MQHHCPLFVRSGLCLGLALVAWMAPAAAQRLPITNYTSSDGLPASQVLDILHDRRGFIWIATASGLCRFDGLSFETVTAHDLLVEDTVRTVVEDGHGDIWFGTNTGVFRYDGRHIESFSTADGLGAGVVWDSTTDHNGQVWFATQNGGVSVYLGTTFKSSTTADGLAENYAYSVLADSTGHLWVGSRNAGVARCTPDPDGILHDCRIFDATDGLPDSPVRALAEGPRGEIYVGYRGAGIARIDGEELTRFDGDTRLGSNDIYALLLNNRNELVIGSVETGVAACELPDLIPCRQIGKRNGLLVETVFALEEDAESNLWIGLNDGLAKLTGENSVSFSERHGLPGLSAYSVCASRDGSIWVGTIHGLARIDASGSARTASLQSFDSSQGLPSNQIWAILEDRRGTLWVGSSRGLCRRNPAGTFTAAQTNDDHQPENILDLLEARDGTVWIASSEGLFRLILDENGDELNFEHFGRDSGLSGNHIYTLAEDTEGRIWAGTRGQGVNVSNQRGFTNYDRSNGLASNSIYSLLAAPDGSIWIGTNGGGLIRALSQPDSRDPIFEDWSHHFPADLRSVIAMTLDMEQRLWLGTSSGLYVLATSPQTRIVQHLDVAGDGSVQEVTTCNSLAGDAHGRIWIAHAGGVTACEALADFKSSDSPQVRIVRLETRDRTAFAEFSTATVPRNNHNWTWLEDSQIQLPHGSKNLRIDYRALSYRAPHHIQFQVRLTGFDSEWSHPISETFKEYTNLDPGRYEFSVRARMGLGAWSTESDSLAIVIKAPFWQRTWFRLLAVALLLAALATLHKTRTRRLQHRADELEHLVQDHTRDLRQRALDLEEINQRIRISDRNKSEFIASMSHEVRTPLNSIIGFAQILERNLGDQLDAKHRRFVNNIVSSGHHLLNLINNVLDLSKIEAGKMDLDIQETTLESIVTAVREIISGQADRRGVTVITTIPEHTPPILLDVPKTKQILFNLLANAVRFSESGQSVELAGWLSDDSGDQEQLNIEVKDHGLGISEDDIQRIFDEFQQAGTGSDRGGTGLGLAIVRQLTEFLGGSVTVESTPGEGSRFRVTLPVDLATGNEV